jgi:hypothetical protein
VDVGGNFRYAGSPSFLAHSIARWGEVAWTSVGGGVSMPPLLFDDGLRCAAGVRAQRGFRVIRAMPRARDDMGTAHE